ncbi:hypothetical protein AMECASPLE_035069 [Ameca splendens]|uniref:Uncharacterized protein n=1 Tax=Ameca splendens TaxID=208324 RepID=A0ABV1A588_9TELE
MKEHQFNITANFESEKHKILENCMFQKLQTGQCVIHNPELQSVHLKMSLQIHQSSALNTGGALWVRQLWLSAQKWKYTVDFLWSVKSFLYAVFSLLLTAILTRLFTSSIKQLIDGGEPYRTSEGY